MDEAPNGEGSNWAETWSVMKILRGHLQVLKYLIPDNYLVVPNIQKYAEKKFPALI